MKRWMMRNDRIGGSHVEAYGCNDGCHPLVVIDPADREQVERFAKACPDDWAFEQDAETLREVVDQLQAVLREFADPKPPKPEEPTGLGAVVEDEDGRVYVRIPNDEAKDDKDIWFDCRGDFYGWEHIAAVRVLSEGVQAGGSDE